MPAFENRMKQSLNSLFQYFSQIFTENKRNRNLPKTALFYLIFRSSWKKMEKQKLHICKLL
ncbi:hypothetical protein C1634_003330 [Chryseobacterium viscerum]|uniref:Uncharacterized protein n=1 Tax=Chryseobacterium viscerum TaxID=1037377 RepID=A0A316WX82_9FLAO|nr:hypothetical protein C1634_003330 [Chryseobacterium viscerum]